MKRFLLAAGLLASVYSGASAADLGARVAPLPVVAPPLFSWTGFYVGVNVGYGFSEKDHHDDYYGLDRSLTIPTGATGFFATNTATVVASPFAPVAPFGVASTINPFGVTSCSGFFDDCSRRNRDGFVGGIQNGYNYQITPGAGFVVGYESDIQFAGFNRRNNDDHGYGYGFGFGGFGNTVTTGSVIGTTVFGTPAFAVPLGGATSLTFTDPFRTRYRQPIDYFGTIRARVGYAFDRFLVYATGGLAYGRSYIRDNDVPVGVGAVVSNLAVHGGCGFNDDCNRMRYGYAAGGGVEYAFTNNWSAKIEGLYVNLNDRRDHYGNQIYGTNTVPFARDNLGLTYFAPITAFNVAQVNRRHDDSFVVVRAGLNFRFNFPAPVAAPVAVKAAY
jgi:outer membrane immunogenic protein